MDGSTQYQGHSWPADPTHVLTRAQARAAGLDLAELRGPRFQKVFFDLYVSSSVALTPRVRAGAALKISAPGAHASHYTAAELWGGCVPVQASRMSRFRRERCVLNVAASKHTSHVRTRQSWCIRV
jgi:hypothetical protein